MTDNEIIKALECCAVGHSCKGKCPLDDGNDSIKICTSTLSKSALDLINRQKAEIERLKDILIKLRELHDRAKGMIATQNGEIEQLKADNERLKNHIQEGIDLAKQIPEMIALVKAEAYKEFAERLNEKMQPYIVLGGGVAEFEIENTRKELTDKIQKG